MKQQLEQLRFAVISDQPCWFDGKEYRTRGPFLSFMTSFSIYFKEVVLFVPVKEGKNDDAIFVLPLANNIRIIPLPLYKNIHELYSNFFRIIPKSCKILYQNMNSFDIAFIIDPRLHTFLSYLLCKWKSKNIVLYMRASTRSYFLQYHNRMKQVLGHFFGMAMDLFFFIMLRTSLTFVVGDELYNKYKKFGPYVHKYYANLISEKDITRNDVIPKTSTDKLRLLTVGRLVPQKGHKYLIHAIDELVSVGQLKLICYIVGEGEERIRLEKFIKSKNLNKYFNFLGRIPWGEELFRIYKMSDIFVLPSLTEGFPKTLFEAMTMGTSIIATDVGGVNGIIKHNVNGILVKPGSSSALAEAIYRLSSEKALCNHLIENGYHTVRQYTLEKQQSKMLDIMIRHFSFFN